METEVRDHADSPALADATARSSSAARAPRARLVVRESELGRWTRAVRPAHPLLRPVLYRDLLGFSQDGAGFGSWLEPPRLALTLMVDLVGSLRADGAALPDSWLCGLSDRYSVVEFGGAYTSLDIELTPLGAYAVLGRPLHELAGAVVTLEDLFGRTGRVLAERMRDAREWDLRFDLLEAFLLERVYAGPRPAPAVEWALARLGATGGGARIGELAAELGCSRRHLLTLFREQVGLAPKAAARVLRFEHLCRRLDADPVSWADIAHDCGYSDQAHLNHDFRDLAGTTPTDFVARRVPGGGVIGDGLPFLQDSGRGAG